ncbi:DUF3017 domain-containing protein [Corynebacterium pelargi]|uniref:Uncharacterized protein n=1 Tax=Corynebacterium pelargi TaxID=1471400 RepID=A0A410WAM0_9CORY|nr:DUF3017 domain-containing protein [Corynebacterium pelargi]QAU53001.1 hypothetical protein CPELA_08730 [Corynebacterium pelargi]GGG75523.1 hypothetical protein GCM10007338_11400 [Corynebacterium pelargi]
MRGFHFRLSQPPVQRPSLRNPHDVALPPSKVPVALQWIGIGIFVGLALASGIYSFGDHWRRASFTLGGAMLLLSLLRLSCDSSIMGIFAVRSRKFDAAFTAAIGGLMLFLSATVESLGS